jgi:hypothetical protein
MYQIDSIATVYIPLAKLYYRLEQLPTGVLAFSITQLLGGLA